MKRKSLIIMSIVLLILSLTTISFATNTNEVKNTVHNATDTVVDGATALTNDIKQGINTTETTIENGVKDVGNAISGGMTNMENMGNNPTTTATRTATYNNTSGTTNTLWIWLPIAIATVAIVGLVWYYASQQKIDR